MMGRNMHLDGRKPKFYVVKLPETFEICLTECVQPAHSTPIQPGLLTVPVFVRLRGQWSVRTIVARFGGTKGKEGQFR